MGNDGDTNDNNVYETDASVNMYLGLHYPSSGKAEGVSPILPHEHSPTFALRFPQRVGALLQSLAPKQTTNALDIGCAVGGSSFQLAKSFDHVDAFDFSHAFVQMAQRMQKQDSITFRVPIEAEIHETVQAVHEEGITSEVRSKVNFFQGDACQIPQMVQDGKLLTSYDGVIMSNLLCRLKDPMACLRGIASIVNPGGVVVIVTPYSWLTEFTARKDWLGGYYKEDDNDDKPVSSKDVLKRVMNEEGFDKIHEEEMPLIIREHQRKYQYIVSQATGWRKKE